MYKLVLVCFLVFTLTYRGKSQDQVDAIFRVYFKNNISQLDSSEMNRLRVFLHKGFQIEKIIGYADSVGTNAYNLKLSKLRSENVYSLLVNEQVNIMNDALQYKGEFFADSASLEQSRKVEIVVRHPVKVVIPDSVENKQTIEIPMDNIYFLPDKTILAPECIDYVERLADRLLLYKRHKILIVGHVNYQGKLSNESNGLFKLSEDRARVLFNIFSDHGISANNMTFKGVGNTEPSNSDPKTYEEKTRNMRVQLFLIPM